ncbi:MAG: 50S ribosomal protein L13 [Phycisphaerales bacterium]
MPRQTTFAKSGDVTQEWVKVDASGKVLGRLAVEIATVLMGKHRPEYTPHVDTGDYVVVIHAEKVVLSGRKAEQKMHTHWTGYPGGLRKKAYGAIREDHPTRLIELAVRRMLPKNRLGRDMYRKLKVYAGEEHPHHAQQPTTVEL